MKEDLKPTQKEIEEANRKQNSFAIIGTSKAPKSIAEMLWVKEYMLRYEAWFNSLPPEQKLKFMVFEKNCKVPESEKGGKSVG